MQVEIPSSNDHGAERNGEFDNRETQKEKMVAISMYRGNLHKVPDVPRRWRMPERNLSFKDFKSLLHRRKRALSRLSFNSNPNLNRNDNTELVTDQEDPILLSEGSGSSGKQKLVEVRKEEIDGNRIRESANERRDSFEGARAGGSDSGDLPGRVTEVKETDNVPHEDATNDKAEANDTAEKVPNEIEKKRKEVEERLRVLNAKKHNLVQVLKQILNAEEEVKRRSYMQQHGTTATRPSLPLHVDVSNDSGGNAGTHMEGGETDDAANHNNAQSRTVLRLCGASSSSESPLRRAAAFSQHTMVPHPSRWSPRLGPSQPGAALTVSASGTNYMASSPSPVGSGGTSVFRESRLQSPWN